MLVKKMVKVEVEKEMFVEEFGREDVPELIELVYRLQDAGHFASIQLSNYGHDVQISVKVGGFVEGSDYDIFQWLNFGDVYVDQWHDCRLRMIDILEFSAQAKEMIEGAL